MKIHLDNPFIIDFKNELTKVKNQEHLIQIEITQIDAFTSANTRFTKTDKFGFEGNKTNSVFNLSYLGSRERFNKVFHEYLKYGLCQLNEGEILYPHFKESHEQAKQFAEYYVWLKEYKGKPNSLKQYSDLNNDQKLLALHFLFPNLRDYTKTQIAIVLGQILNIGSEPVRKNLSNLYDGKKEIYNIENLQKLLELFDNKTFESITNKIEREIKQMS